MSEMDTLNDVLRIVQQSDLYDMRAVVSPMYPFFPKPSNVPGFDAAMSRALIRLATRRPDERTLRRLASEQTQAMFRQRTDMQQVERTNEKGERVISYEFKKNQE